MQLDRAVITHLNAQLPEGRTAVNRYFLHARKLKHWGLGLIDQVGVPTCLQSAISSSS